MEVIENHFAGWVDDDGPGSASGSVVPHGTWMRISFWVPWIMPHYDGKLILQLNLSYTLLRIRGESLEHGLNGEYLYPFIGLECICYLLQGRKAVFMAAGTPFLKTFYIDPFFLQLLLVELGRLSIGIYPIVY